MSKHIDLNSLTIIFITFLLFFIALFVKGFTHDMLLEAGVLVISIKLIMMAYQHRVYIDELKEELREIKALILHSVPNPAETGQ
jgi:cell division protein FtsL